MTVTVYGLCSSDNEIIRYVGQTVQDIRCRLRQHLSDAKGRKKATRLSKWIRSVLNKECNVLVKELYSNAIIHETEINTIKEYRAKGFDLVNLTDGGEGTIGYHPVSRPRPDLAENNRLRSGSKCQPLSDEHKKKISESNKGKKKPFLSERNRLATGKPGRVQTEAERLKRSNTLKGRVISPEWRAKLSVAAKRRYESEVICACN